MKFQRVLTGRYELNSENPKMEFVVDKYRFVIYDTSEPTNILKKVIK